MIGGFYAQWEENAREVSRNKQSQGDMLKIIENTNRNLYDLTRILRPLGKSNIYLSFKLNCVEVKDFCDATRARAEKERSIDRVASFSIPDVDWMKWPDNRVIVLIFLRLFKDNGAAQRYLKGDCIECESNADVSFRAFFDVSERAVSEHNSPVDVMYQVSDKQIFILIRADEANPEVNSDKILSTIDLPGATLIARAQNGFFNKMALISVDIQTDHGQTIKIENPIGVNSNNETAFEYVFPDFAH